MNSLIGEDHQKKIIPLSKNKNKFEIMNREYKTITKYYEDQPVLFYIQKGKAWISGRTIEEGLSLSKGNINTIYSRHKTELEPYTTYVKLSYEGKLREHRCYDEIGFIGICFLSGSKKGEPFRIWALAQLKGIIEGKPFEMLDYLEQQALMNLNTVRELKIVRGKLTTIEKKVIEIEEREIIEDEDTGFLHDTVHFTAIHLAKRDGLETELYRTRNGRNMERIVDSTQRASYYNKALQPMKDKFKISSYKKIPRKKSKELIEWVKDNPFYII